MMPVLHAFSGFSVGDLAAAREFYAGKLGLEVVEGQMDNLQLRLPGGHEVFVYEKPYHEPATFTILNFVVQDIDAAVKELNAAGVETKIYDDPNLPTDGLGIARGRSAGYGPDIAWFRDPAGNVLSVLST